MTEEFVSKFKIILLGESDVGKTSIALRFVNQEFDHALRNTIGIDFMNKDIIVKNKKKKERVRIHIWDTAGQERFHTITKAYYRNAHGIMLIFSMADTSSFECVDKWIDIIKENLNEDVPIYLLGNKSDIKTGDHIRYIEKAKNLGFKYFECSAKSGENVLEIFMSMAEDIISTNTATSASKVRSRRNKIVDFVKKKKCW